MEHPHVPSAKLDSSERRSIYTGYSPEAGKPFYLFSLSPQQQREHGLLNYSARLVSGGSLNANERSLPEWMYEIPNVRGLENYVEYYLPENDDTNLVVSTRIEQRPNPNSRVSLSSQTDALGERRLELNWDLTEDEKRTIRVANETIAEECGRLGIGRLQLMDWMRTDSSTWPDDLKGGHHHMGTTRMDKSPGCGVVNENCKVHGVENLHIAGSSVFPTSGTANPTLTIVAMALRLADHLQGELET
jgi:choline dehydrogenase-like flavoprotein